MNHPALRLAVVFAALAVLGSMTTLLGAAPIRADPVRANDPSIPPVERANLHQLVFANDDLAILNNVYPPHSDSGYHRHGHPLFYVVVDPAHFGAQLLGRALVIPPMAPAGSTGYNLMPDGPITHRVVNGDRRTCHIIAIELLRPAPSGHAASDRAPVYVQLFDNERMRAWRLILPPGASAPAVRQGDAGVRVVVRGGTLVTARPGLPDQTLALTKGDFAVQQAVGEERSRRNAGAMVIELVEMELK